MRRLRHFTLLLCGLVLASSATGPSISDGLEATKGQCFNAGSANDNMHPEEAMCSAVLTDDSKGDAKGVAGKGAHVEVEQLHAEISQLRQELAAAASLIKEMGSALQQHDVSLKKLEAAVALSQAPGIPTLPTPAPLPPSQPSQPSQAQLSESEAMGAGSGAGGRTLLRGGARTRGWLDYFLLQAAVQVLVQGCHACLHVLAYTRMFVGGVQHAIP